MIKENTKTFSFFHICKNFIRVILFIKIYVFYSNYGQEKIRGF